MFADLLNQDRVPWAQIITMGGDLNQIEIEAGQYGDTVLLRKVRRARVRHGV